MGYQSPMTDAPPRSRSDFAIAVYADIACPWAHIALHRLRRIRRELGLDDEIPIDHRAFPLEIVNSRPTPEWLLRSEIPTCQNLEPSAGWSNDPDPWTYPVSTLPALEAVQASKSQGIEVSERLDAALRRAMFEQWRCLAVFGVVLDVAGTVEELDVDRLWSDIRQGDARAEVLVQLDDAQSRDLPGSPTLVLPDGSVWHNPGIEFHWEGDPGDRLVIDADDPDAYRPILEQSRAAQPAD